MPPKKRQAASKPSYGAIKRRLRSQKAVPPPPGLPDDEAKKHTFESPYPQRFSLPESIIYYIARNPKNVECHQNLMKSCKLLFRMSRIVPVENVEDVYCENGQMELTAMNKWKPSAEACITGRIVARDDEIKDINLDKPLFSKFWIHHELLIEMTSSNCASNLVKHIAKCTLKELTLQGQVLTFAELQILAAGDKLEKVDFHDNVITSANGTAVDFEDIVETLYCKKMRIKLPLENHGVGKDTATKMAEIMESNGREYSVRIVNIPEIFNMQSFSGFLKANMNNRHHDISLYFAESISPAYKNQLEEIIKEIIQIRNVYAHTIPFICYPGQNDEYWNELCKMRNQRFNGLIKKRGYSYTMGTGCIRYVTKVTKDTMM